MQLLKSLKLLKAICSWPVISVTLTSEDAACERMYCYFREPHPRLFFIRHKGLGMATIALAQYKTYSNYLSMVSGKSSAAYAARRCSKLGYETRQINPAHHLEEIMAVNLSAEYRQGRPMSETYRQPIDYPMDEYNSYWGVFKDEVLVSYCCVKINGELRLLNRLLAHQAHLKNRVMYKMLLDIMAYEFAQYEKDPARPVYVMYDSYLGISEGLAQFKRKTGFRPYRVTWKLKNLKQAYSKTVS